REPDGPPRNPRGGRHRHRVSVLRRCRVHHRPVARRRRRSLHRLMAAAPDPFHVNPDRKPDTMTNRTERPLEDIIGSIRDFVRTELWPLESEFRQWSFRAFAGLLAEKRRRVKDLGLWCPFLPT